MLPAIQVLHCFRLGLVIQLVLVFLRGQVVLVGLLSLLLLECPHHQVFLVCLKHQVALVAQAHHLDLVGQQGLRVLLTLLHQVHPLVHVLLVDQASQLFHQVQGDP